MTRNQFTYAGPALAMLLAAGGTALVLAQAPAAPGHHETTGQPAAAQAGAMMADQKAMMARMAAGDQKLTGLIAAMNKATGDAKVAAIAAVVTELAAQRTEMQAQMVRMQGGMMDQMMSHMSTMHGAGGMMNRKAPEPAPAPAEPDHAAHHPDK